MVARDGGEGRFSQHPTDRLIRELIRTGRGAAPDEIARIVERMATAPFDTRVIPVPIKFRGLTYRGRTLGARETSLVYHLIKRVVDEHQWVAGTAEADYVADLRQAVRVAQARLGVYERRGGSIAVALAPTAVAVPATRRTSESLPDTLVVYSADRGIMLSGYQVSGLAETGVPEDVLWLK